MSVAPSQSGDRDRGVERVIWIEGAINATIAAVKAGVGFATGSTAILGDAVHSLTDLANNVLAWMVVRWSSEPPDAEHPYGHRKFESVAVFVLATVLAVTAFELALAALRSRSAPAHADWALVIMFGVLLVNIALATWQSRQARRLASQLIQADARHTLSDILVTLATIAGWQAAAWGYPWFDTAAALVVAGLVFYLAYGLFRRSLPMLVDGASLDPAQLQMAAASVAGVREVKQVRSRAYGHRSAVDLVILVSADLSTAASHDIATQVEATLRARFPVEAVVVHVEPVATHPGDAQA